STASSPIPSTSTQPCAATMEPSPLSVELTLQNQLPSSAMLQSRKRKRSQPAYMGDLSLEDMSNTKKAKKMWDIATRTIIRQKKTLAYLQNKECIPTCQQQLLLRQLKLTTGRKFPAELRTFALTLHFYSSSAYDYVRTTFGKCLPHPTTLRKWYSAVDGSPGYT
ncbi:hypothetical protein CBL_21275, partial [Carabus blaptoides fortunei]